MINWTPKQLQLRVIGLILLLLAVFQGCGEDPASPGSQANVRTTVSLDRHVISPGDTIVATVSAVNEGSASASFVFYCGRYLWTSIENSGNQCFAGCVERCGTQGPIPLELRPGEMLRKTFRHASVDREGMPFPPGLYVVIGGIAAQGAKEARAGFVISEL